MNRLLGKKVVIAGAGQTPGQDIGNGRAIAILFAREGADLFITARHYERAEETARIIHEENPFSKVFPYELDATNEDAVRTMYKNAAECLDGIDIMVDNIGVLMHEDAGLQNVDNATFDVMTTINEKTALYLIRNVYPYMKDRGGSVVLISSVAGVMIGKNTNMYNMTKSAMIHIGKSFASLYAEQGIRINTIILGMVKTSMAIKFNEKSTGMTREDMIRLRDESIPLKGGQGTAWDTAYAALFLASDEAKYITGVSLPVDGGMTIAYR